VSPSLEQRVAELETRNAEHETRIAALEQQLASRFGPRDDADRAVLPFLITAMVGRDRFTSADVMRCADLDESLRLALADADVVDRRECGYLLRRLEACPLEGLRLAHVGRTRRGLNEWSFIPTA
jgi:hypothetical protein